MKIKGYFPNSILLITLLASLSVGAQAQRIYDKERDAQAILALKLAEEIKSNSSFEKQLRNLNILSKQDFANYFIGQRREIRARLNSFTTWKDVARAVDRVRTDLDVPNPVSGLELAQRKKEIQMKIDNAKAELKREKEEADKKLEELKKRLGAGELTEFFERIGELQALYEVGERILVNHALDDQDNAEDVTNYVKVADEVKNTLAILKNLYTAYTARIDEITNRRNELLELEQPLKLAVLEALEVEEEHWKNLGAIAAKREAEQEDLRDLVASYEHVQESLDLSDNERIEDSVKNAVNNKNRDRLINIFYVLHLASALTVRGSTPQKLAALRVTHEEHRYSIRQSAVRARTYELTVLTGVQRLALYHQGGIKPETLARLFHSISSLAIPPAILVK
jgi:predicted nuclease with TOPRIM domain